MKICEKFNVFIIFSPYAKIFKTKNLNVESETSNYINYSVH